MFNYISKLYQVGLLFCLLTGFHVNACPVKELSFLCSLTIWALFSGFFCLLLHTKENCIFERFKLYTDGYISL